MPARRVGADSVQSRHRAWWCHAIGFACVASLFLVSGCQKSSHEEWVRRPELTKLAAVHQEAIDTILATSFGSLQRPKWLLPRQDESGQAVLDEQGRPIWDVVKVSSQRLRHGQHLYQRYCVGCHGASGDGAGPAAAYLNPRPRDYRLGVFKFTSTPYGAKPRREDLDRIIRYGAKGTSMPAFRWLSDEDRQALVDYVLYLSRRGEMELALINEAGQYSEEERLEPAVAADLALSIEALWQQAESQRVVPVTPRPAYTAESRRLGYQAFVARDCIKCHGRDGRGHTQENVGKDAWGNTVHAADLTSGFLHGGRRPVDIYRRIYSGINGTPMPAYATALANEPEVIWHMAHFVLGLATGEPLPELPQEAPAAQAGRSSIPAGQAALKLATQKVAKSPGADPGR